MTKDGGHKGTRAAGLCGWKGTVTGGSTAAPGRGWMWEWGNAGTLGDSGSRAAFHDFAQQLVPWACPPQ